jgi:REP element-mobilizing transposase RayT
MSTGGYKIRNKEGIHFISFAVVGWIDVFTRKDYKDILISSLQHCQNHRGLNIHVWCIMSNHVHLIVSAKHNDTSEILRDFKKYTAKTIIKAIEANRQESRREWMLELFSRAGKKNSRNKNYQFWRQDYLTKDLFSERFTDQKLEYSHNNPVDAGLDIKSEEYVYSCARDYYEGKNVGLLKIDFL